MSELIKMGTYFKSVVTCYAEIENCVLKQEECAHAGSLPEKMILKLGYEWQVGVKVGEGRTVVKRQFQGGDCM